MARRFRRSGDARRCSTQQWPPAMHCAHVIGRWSETCSSSASTPRSSSSWRDRHLHHRARSPRGDCRLRGRVRIRSLARRLEPFPITGERMMSAAAHSLLPPKGSDRGLPPSAPLFEPVVCYLCGGADSTPFVDAQDDLTGQTRNVSLRHVCDLRAPAIRTRASRSTTSATSTTTSTLLIARSAHWGLLTALVEHGMRKLDADKERIISRYVTLTNDSTVLDVGCAVGTFLQRLRERHALQRRRGGLQGSVGSPVAARRRVSPQPLLRGIPRACAVRPGDDVAFPRA